MRSTVVAYLLWCLVFVGFAGIHRLYAGRIVTGLIWLFTGGLLFIGQFIDLFLIPGMIDEENLRARVDALEARRW
jgi:TM2 domain-containing membrane protein YozV